MFVPSYATQIFYTSWFNSNHFIDLHRVIVGGWKSKAVRNFWMLAHTRYAHILCMRCITINLPRSIRWEGYWPLRDITQRCCHGYASNHRTALWCNLSLPSPHMWRDVESHALCAYAWKSGVKVKYRDNQNLFPLYLPLRSQRCEWAINLIFLVRTCSWEALF